MLFVEYPKCTTCKKAKKFLDDHNIKYTDRDIKSENPTAEEIAAWYPQSGKDLKAFLQDHSKEVIKLAIKECVGNGKPYFKYLSSILRDWKQKGLVTVELVENRQKPARSSRKSGRMTLDDDGYDPRYGF